MNTFHLRMGGGNVSPTVEMRKWGISQWRSKVSIYFGAQFETPKQLRVAFCRWQRAMHLWWPPASLSPVPGSWAWLLPPSVRVSPHDNDHMLQEKSFKMPQHHRNSPARLPWRGVYGSAQRGLPSWLAHLSFGHSSSFHTQRLLLFGVIWRRENQVSNEMDTFLSKTTLYYNPIP